MKTLRRLPALLLLPALCACLLLGGCSKTPPASPDQVAAAFYDMVVRMDAAALKDILGYESEEALWDDFVGGKEGYRDTMVGSIKAQFESLGFRLTDEDSQRIYTSIMDAMGRLSFSAEVREMDEKSKTAVVVAHIGYYDPDDLSEMTDNSVTAAIEGLDEEAFQTQEGIDQFFANYLAAYCDGLAGLSPADGQRDLTVDFEFVALDGNGTTREAWMPTDAASFGLALSNAAMGG